MKVALIVLGCVLVLSVTLLSLRVHVQMEYAENGLLVQVRGACFHFTIIPASKKRKKKKKKPKTAEKELDGAVQDVPSKKGGSLSKFRGLLSLGLEMLGTLAKRIQIDYLRVHYVIAGQPDPAKAALQYGGVCVGGGAICILLEQHMKVKERNVSAEVDFCSESSVISIAASCSLRIGQAIMIALKLFKGYMSWKKQQDQTAQEENRDG